MKKFTQEHPASRFGEAYPVGNGHMGAVVYGSFPVERIVLTENTFFSGKRSTHNNQKGAADAFREMRRLLKKGDYKGAHKTAEKFHGVRGNYGTSLPVGTLEIDFSGENIALEEGKYSRSLDYENGIAESFFRKKDLEITSETWASHPDKVLVWHIKSSEEISFFVRFCPYRDNGEMQVSDRGFTYISRALETRHCDEPCGTTLYGSCRVVTDGQIVNDDGNVRIKDAKEAVLYLTAETDYALLMDAGEEAVTAKRRREFEAQTWAELAEREEKLLKKGFEKIRKAHREDVSSIMNRVLLKLSGEDASESEKAEKAAELFQYGRYLLLSSSREDSLLPTQLQGIWNDNVACCIGWSCDMHLDINTQMNYWPADVTNLPETMPPLVRWVKRLAEEGRQTAEESYGLKGWAAEIVSNAWCFGAPYWSPSLSPYPTGGAWILSQLWEHYEYTKDLEFLEEIYPLIEGAAEFFSGYVFEEEDTGMLSCGPSVSAENSFLVDGNVYQISNGCTYEIAVIREVFENYLKINALLEKGGRLSEQIAEQVKRLPVPRILSDGTLAEWSHDFPAADEQHRHTSHLITLFPFAQITPEDTPQLAAAARKSIEKKLSPYERWEDTGWARSLLLLYEARLHDGEKAWFHVSDMMEKLLEPNGMIYHPPTRGTLFEDDFGHVYELDGNTGLTSGIGEMLLQSHKGKIRLLPAIPKAWTAGHVKGLKARGGITVEIRWEEGEICEFALISKEDCRCTLEAEGRTMELELKSGKPYRWEK